MKPNKQFSILPSTNLRYKFVISFSLMSIIPLLVIGYLVSNYVLGYISNVAIMFWLFIAVVVTIIIAFLGYTLIKKSVLMPIMYMAADAKNITAGDLRRVVEVSAEDEIGEVAEAINFLTDRIRTNMDELKDYGEKTKEINLKIHQKILVLSALLNISHMISQGTKLEELFKEIVSKITELTDIQKVALALRDESGDFAFNHSVAVDKRRFEGAVNNKFKVFLERPLLSMKPFSVSGITKLSREAHELLQEFSSRSVLFVPILIKGALEGVLFLGSDTKEFFEKEDIDTYTVFAKQISIAIDNDRLIKRNSELAVLDELTGLFNKRYTASRLDEEIRRAIVYQRPCAYIVLDVDGFSAIAKTYGEDAGRMLLKKVAATLKKFVSPVDRLGRLDADRFAFVLPEKNKPQAIALARQIIEEVHMKDFEVAPGKKLLKITISAGISENPIDGSSAQDLITRAEQALRKAKIEGKNCVRT